MSEPSASEPPADDLDDHITKREVIKAFNHLGSDWNKAFEVLYAKIDDLTQRLTNLAAVANPRHNPRTPTSEAS